MQAINIDGTKLKERLEAINKDYTTILNELNKLTTQNIKVQESINNIQLISPNSRIAEIDSEMVRIDSEIDETKVERSDVIDKERLTGELKQLLIGSGGKQNVTNLEEKRNKKNFEQR